MFIRLDIDRRRAVAGQDAGGASRAGRRGTGDPKHIGHPATDEARTVAVVPPVDRGQEYWMFINSVTVV